MSIAVGETLPELVVDASVRNIVATAIATRDYQDVHHDIAAAQERGSKTIFTNILTSNGYCLRYVTDWTGPDAVVKKASIRLGGELQLGPAAVLGELGRADADDRGLPREGPRHDGTSTVTVPVTWSPSELLPRTATVTSCPSGPSSAALTVPLIVIVSPA